MLKLIKVLRATPVFSARGIFYLTKVLLHTGINLMALLYFAARLYPRKTALVQEGESITYQELYQLARKLAMALKEQHNLLPGHKIGIAAANHPEFICSLFASACLGTDVYLLNAEMGQLQFQRLTERHQFDFIIYDPSFQSLIEELNYQEKSLVTIPNQESGIPAIPSVRSMLYTAAKRGNAAVKIKRFSFNKIIVLTSGTTGTYKTASRKASISAYTGLFASLLQRLNFTAGTSIYIATPVTHGFGMAALCFSFLLGNEVYITTGFDSEQAAAIIQENQIRVITLVPLMLRRLLDQSPRSVQSLQCILSAGATLPPALAQKTIRVLGNKLYNLYGTSEAGVCTLATPMDLKKLPDTIGKPLDGVQIKIITDQGIESDYKTPGQLYIKCAWSAAGKKWVKSGDIGYKDKNGYYYLLGRADDMIVSGAENVYPYELENILSSHPAIKEVAVSGMDDPEFGQRLAAFIVLREEIITNKQEILLWLSSRAARYHTPKKMLFIDQIPLTSMGKPDKKRLLTLL